MYGAILGDMIGAPYEFDRGEKTKDFPMFSEDSQFTDDTVMTIAVAEVLLDNYRAGDDALVYSFHSVRIEKNKPAGSTNRLCIIRLLCVIQPDKSEFTALNQIESDFQ